jgi:Mobilization protein NikA
MPRPPKDDPRHIKMTVRISRAEMAELDRRAKAVGLSPTAYARQRMFEGFVNAAGETTAYPTPIQNPALYALTQEARRIGVNLNQIAHRVNEYHLEAVQALPDTLTKIRDFVRLAQQKL